MTTQSNPSPFSTDIKTDNIPTDLPIQQPAQNDFQMRTMKEDLSKLQASGIIMEKAPAATNPANKQESSLPAQQTQTQIKPSSLPKQEAIKPTVAVVETNLTSAQTEAPADIKPNNPVIQEVPVSIQPPKKKKTAFIKIVAAVIILLVIAIIALGAYYFIITKKNTNITANNLPSQSSNEENTATELQPTEEATEDIAEEATESEQAAPVQKYSAENPNYLVIDIINADRESIKNSFQKVADELKTIQMTSPYEFILVDNNNDPIPFTVFSAAAKLNFSPAVFSNFGKAYSVYFYNDNSFLRTGLAIETNNKEKLTKELLADEKNFERGISFLFLNDMVEVKGNPFGSSTYGAYPIRFSNIDAAKNLSIDYSVTDSKFVISTSKNTERAVLDKVFQNPSQTTQSNSAALPVTNNQDISNQTSGTDIESNEEATAVISE